MLFQENMNEEKTSEDNISKEEITPLVTKKIEDYTKIIPQRIENKPIPTAVSEEVILDIKDEDFDKANTENNCENQDLDFSFGKDTQKDNIKNNNSEKTETNNTNNSNNTHDNFFIFKNKCNDSKNQEKFNILDKIDMLSENLSSYQFTDSISNLRDSYMEGSTKLQLIKDKFLSNFKNKDRTKSLQRVLKLFEKYQNYNNRLNNSQCNNSFSYLNSKPFHFWETQKTNSISIFDNVEINKDKDKDKDKNSTDKLDTEYINKSNDNILIQNNTKEILNSNNKDTTDKKEEDKKKSIDKVIFVKKINKQKEKDNNNNKVSNGKEGKKKGFFIRKIIREEKYVIDDDGKEKLVGVKQSTIDTQDKNSNLNMSNIDLKKNTKNISLLNKEKFTEFFKKKISAKGSTNSLSLQSRKKINNDNDNNTIQINTEYINNNNHKNKTINTDGYNNIKIVINKINKINSNPKINLNFIKQLKSKKNNKEQIISTRNNRNLNENNTVYKTQLNNKSVFNLTKPDNYQIHKIEEFKQPIRLNTNFNSYQNKIKSKNTGNIRILKCEKIGDNKCYCAPLINTMSSISYQKAETNKRNYSYKEIRNVSNNSKYIENNNEKEKNLTIGGLNHYNTRNNRSKIIQNIKMNKSKDNHIFYESKSFSNKKILEKKSHNNIDKYNNYYEYNNEMAAPNTVRYNKGNNRKLEKINCNDNKQSINSSRNYFYKGAMNNHRDSRKK
jgi:hypothetical protein